MPFPTTSPKPSTGFGPVPVGGGNESGASSGWMGTLGSSGRPVAQFRLEGGKHRGALGPPEGWTIQRTVQLAVESGVPIIGILSTSGADVHEGVASLHAWGQIAYELSRASGVVPITLIVTGPCVSGPALLLGLADFVVMTDEAFAYVSGPDGIEAFTGIRVSASDLGGAAVHARRSGVAGMTARDEDGALWIAEELLSYLPSNHLEDPPFRELASRDPIDRSCVRSLDLVPTVSTASYDVRDVIADVTDHDSFLELSALHAPNIVTGFASLGGTPVGLVANQPCQRAGTLDVEASRKAAAFVQLCDSFNVPIITLVDTPGYEPGKDLEWRGMIRKGAQLVHAYAAASVPRICLVLRKAYGGAYIVMDSKKLGNDYCFAWPGAEIAVMGAPGAVQILSSRRLAAIEDPDERERMRADLELDYAERWCTATVASERGYVDDVIDPRDTRRVLVAALHALRTKREHPSRAKHRNSPL